MPTTEHLPDHSHRWRLLGWCVLIGGIAAAYSASFDGPFIFDDLSSTVANPYITSLWPPAEAMAAPPRTTVAGRPLVALSLAVNHAVSGLDVWSYHVLNLLIHVACAALLLSIARSVLSKETMPPWARENAHALAWALAVVWALHPINSESVVYIIQRTGLMMAAFTLLAVRALIYAHAQPRRAAWPALVVIATILAALCKETAVVVPVLLLLFDRAFLAGGFQAALRRRGVMYAALCLTWGVVGWLATEGHRGGLDMSPDASWHYLLTQAGVIVWYLRLLVYPHPLAITYHWPPVTGVLESLPASAVVLSLLLATLYLLWRHPKAGFLGAAFFPLLAPTSSVVPIMTEVVAERRMYLPSYVAIAGLVMAAVALASWIAEKRRASVRGGPSIAVGGACLALAAGLATHARTADFDSAVSIWEQTVRVQPSSPIALDNLATQYLERERLSEAEGLIFRLELANPSFRTVPRLWGTLAMKRGNHAQASAYFVTAARAEPEKSDVRAHAGYCFGMLGQWSKADAFLNEALEMGGSDALVRYYVGLLSVERGEVDAAYETLSQAAHRHPRSGRLIGALAVTLDRMGRMDEARKHFQRAYELAPESVEILRNYGTFEARHKNWGVAERVLREALELSPGHKEVSFALAALLRQTERYKDADDVYRPLLRRHPRDPVLHNNYAILLVITERYKEALDHFQTAVALDPDYEEARRNVGLTRRIMAEGEQEASPPLTE